jgi:hypothetical protein
VLLLLLLLLLPLLYPAAGTLGGAEQPQLTQHLVDSSISQDSDTGSADAPISKPAASVLKQLVLATPTQSSYCLYGSHAADGNAFTAQQLQEWPVQDCKDYVVGCGDGVHLRTALWQQQQ